MWNTIQCPCRLDFVAEFRRCGSFLFALFFAPCSSNSDRIALFVFVFGLTLHPQYLKENHYHVASDGKVYLPYTKKWDQRTHSLIEMVVAMSSVFSADPPVFTRAPAPAPPPPPAYSAYVSSSSNNNNNNNNPSATNPNRRTAAAAMTTKTFASASTDGETNSDRYMKEQIAAIMAKEAEEEKQRKQQIAAQRVWEEKKLEQTRTEVNQKIRAYLIDFTEETKSTLSADWRDQEHLKQNKDQIQKETKELTLKKKELEQHIETIDTKTEDIKDWLKESKDVEDEEPEVDDICQPVNKLDAQMLNLSAESAALTDVMYFLDRGMYTGKIDCTNHLKMIRDLAKRQFLIRAHLIKINQVVAKNKQ